MLMLVHLHSVLGRLIVQHLPGPRPLVVRAWFWLAAEADAIEQKRRCLEAVLELNPESQSARAALALLHQREIGRGERASIADDGRQC